MSQRVPTLLNRILPRHSTFHRLLSSKVHCLGCQTGSARFQSTQSHEDDLDLTSESNFNDTKSKLPPTQQQQPEIDLATLEPYKKSPYRKTHGLNIDASLDPDSIVHSRHDLNHYEFIHPLPPEVANEYNHATSIPSSHSHAFEITKQQLHTKFSQYDQKIDTTITLSDDGTTKTKQLKKALTMEALDGKSDQEIEQERDMRLPHEGRYSKKRIYDYDFRRLPPNIRKLPKRQRILTINPDFKVVSDGLDVPITHYKREFVQGSQCEGCGVDLQIDDPDAPGFVYIPPNDSQKIKINQQATDTTPNENENVNEIENEEEEQLMNNVYVSDRQKLFLMDVGKMEGNQQRLTQSQYNDIMDANKLAGNDEKRNRHKRLKTMVHETPVCQRCFQMINHEKYQQSENLIPLRNTRQRTNRIIPIKHMPSVVDTNTNTNKISVYQDMIPSQFQNLLQRRFLRAKQKVCVIKIIDIFDFHGSFIPNLEEIIRETKDMVNSAFYGQHFDIPLIIGLNKIDLLTKHTRNNEQYIVDWAYSECRRFLSKKNKNKKNKGDDDDSPNTKLIIPKAIVPICCKSGYNVDKLLQMACEFAPINKTRIKVKDEDGNVQMINASAKTRYRDIYVIGSANAGKSTLLNKLHQKELIHSVRQRPLTISPIAGTTLGVLPFIVPDYNNTRLLDTPGVIGDHSLALRLTTDELKLLQPKKCVKPRTYELKEGKSLLLGTMGRIDFVEGKPYYFTVFASPRCTTHVCKTEKVESTLARHSCSLLKPVCDKSRWLDDDRLQMVQQRTFTLEGIGWQASVVDVVFPGLGWVAITGCQKFTIDTHYLPGIKVGLRRPLLLRDTYQNVVNKKKRRNR